jgi:hypothetical protein
MPDGKKEENQIPNYAPDESEMESGTTSTPTDYPLFKKLDALIAIETRIAVAVEAIAANMSPKTTTGAIKEEKPKEAPKPATPAPAPEPKPEPKPEPTPVAQPAQASNVEKIMANFPADLEQLLSFDDKGSYIMIKPRQFLGSENFAKIASTVRGLGGEYISAGKDSHFRVKV